MTTIFVSHAKEDNESAEQIRQGLEARGYSTWREPTSLSMESIVRSVHFKPWEHGGQVAACFMLTTVSLMRGEIPLPFGRSG
jgi:hypothetical protein